MLEKIKIGEPWIHCQTFSEIQRISEKMLTRSCSLYSQDVSVQEKNYMLSNFLIVYVISRVRSKVRVHTQKRRYKGDLLTLIFLTSVWNIAFHQPQYSFKFILKPGATALRKQPISNLRTPAYTPTDRLTSWVFSTTFVQYLYISCYLSDNKPVLSYLLSRLLPQTCPLKGETGICVQ